MALVALGILLLNVLFGQPPRPPTTGIGPVVVAPSTEPATPTADPTAAPSPTDLPADPAQDDPPDDPAAERPPLTVLNHSRVTGLAAKAADDFRRGGWEVVEVGNTRYSVAETTVFFAPGQEGAAVALREQFPDVRRSAERPPELPGSGLTVVVTREYPA